MKRKVIQLAGKTFVVSLPLKWAVQHNVRKGDEVDVEINDSQLTINTKNPKTELKTSLILDCTEEFARRRINTLYKRGLDEIGVVVKQPRLLNEIQKELKILMGFEVINRAERSCTIKNIAQPMEQELQVLIKRIFLINIEMSKLIEKILQNKEEEDLQELHDLEDMNDKLTNTCKRVLNKQINQKMDKTNLTYCILWVLEKLGDDYLRLGRSLFDKKDNKSFTKIILNINSFHRSFYEIFCKFDERKASQFTEEYRKLKKDCEAFLEKQPLIGHHAFNIVRDIYELAGPYYATIL